MHGGPLSFYLFPKGIFLYGIFSEVVLGPKVSKFLHWDHFFFFFEAGWRNLRVATQTTFLREVKSAAYQLVTIHIELTARVAFYLLSLFSTFSHLCPLHNNQENGKVIKMILQFQLIKIQSQWGRWSAMLQFSIFQLTGFLTAAQFNALYCPWGKVTFQQ